MSSKTPHLNLTLPANGEFTDTWDEPLRSNFETIDSSIEDIDSELTASRGTKATLKEFLDEGHENNGALKSMPEVISARNSSTYGDRFLTTNTDYTLSDRLEQGDKDVFDAREGSESLRKALASKVIRPSMILSGSFNINGYPTWMAFSGDKVQIDGVATPIVMLIEGYKSRIRSLEEITLVGAAGTYHIYTQLENLGVMRVNGNPSEIGPPTPPVSSTGVTSTLTGENAPRLFTDATKNFTLLDVDVGDILYIETTTAKGRYIIEEVAPGGNVNQLKIVGHFPVSISAIPYTINDPLALTFGFEATKTSASGKFHIGEADFDGLAVTAIRPRHFKDEFISEWRPIDVTTITTFEEIFSHNLGSLNLDYKIQVSQADDGSQPIENLYECLIGNNLGFSGSIGSLGIDDTLTVTQPTLTPGTQSIDTPVGVTHSVNISGLPGGTITGQVYPLNSVRTKFDANKLWVKNAIAGKFYKNYNDNEYTTGYIRVLVKKRG